MNLDLVILEGPEAGRRIPVSGSPVTLGRAPAAAMAFPDDGFISSVHVSIQADPEGVRITDLRSTNGTFLNGERVNSALAGVGDVIQIGTMTMQVATALAASAPAVLPVFSSPKAAGASSPSEATMIGAPALPRMDIPAPPPMAASIVATTTIPRISVDGAEQFRRLETARKVGAESLQKALLERIASLEGPLFLMVNAAADETIPAMLAMGDVDLAKHSLFQDASAVPARWTPYLLSTTPDSPLLSGLLDRGWGKNWFSIFSSSADLSELQTHFGKFLRVQMDQTGGIYFRFYDPQVLREFLPSGNPSELAIFFGSVREWLLEGETKSTLIKATHSPDGLRMHSITLND